MTFFQDYAQHFWSKSLNQGPVNLEIMHMCAYRIGNSEDWCLGNEETIYSIYLYGNWIISLMKEKKYEEHCTHE